MKVEQSIFRRTIPSLGRWLAKTNPQTTVTRSFSPATRLAALQTSIIPEARLSLRGFSMRSLSSEAQSSLTEILAREENEEISGGNGELPYELADLKSSLEQNWKIVENEASTSLFLKEKKVQVSFHCQDTVAEAIYDEEHDAEEHTDPVRFCVTVSKLGKSLVINCVSEFGQARIEGVTTTTSPPETIHAGQGNLPEKTSYQGPDFVELEEDLQDAFAVYLEEECGVTSDVATFVAMYTDYREQLLYMEFLKNAQSVIS